MKLKILITLLFVVNSTFCITSSPQQQAPDITALFQKINSRSYCTQILPHDFSSLLQLLDHGKKNKKKSDYFERVFRTFTRLVKEAPCINAYAFKDALYRFPELMKDAVIPTTCTQLDTKKLLELDIIDRFKGSVNSLLYNQFLHEYAGFKKDPEHFLEQLSDQITTIVHEEYSITQLRTILVRFLETCLAKLAWLPDHQEEVWHSTKAISENLKKLVDYNIIDDVDDLDDTYWSLVHRFCVFIDLFSTNLSLEFYNTVQNDIARKKLLLTELEEQQDWLISKSDFLNNAIQEQKTRLLAHQNGIITR